MNSVNGIFVQASDDQLTTIWTACALHGFTQDAKGILALLMLAAEPEEDDEDEEDAPDPIRSIIDHLAQNPQQAEALKQASVRLFGSVLNKFKK